LKAAAVVLALAAIPAGAAQADASAPGRTVPCREIILATKWPHLGNRNPEHRYRTILDAISVPPAYMQQVSTVDNGPWTHFRKQGLVVRAGARPVTVSLAPAWRDRAAIAWGNAGHGPFSSIRVARCSRGSGGYAYAGGFFLRASSACLPLVFHVGSRSQTVRFGVGRRCT
jgi:hypothetical protein